MKTITAIFLGFLLLFNVSCFSQTDDEKPSKKKSKFQTGMYIGSYFANKSTAKLYDGYGYDADGVRNNFSDFGNMEKSSFMFRKIVMEYGGGYGQTDQVALALGVNHGEWSFQQDDMPANMKYMPAIMVGIEPCYIASKTDALFVNINASKLLLGGNFTIVVDKPIIGTTTPGYKDIRTFAITGAEERLVIQPGYRKLLSDDDVFNFFIEGGPSFNITKYMQNMAVINNLRIDLGSFYSQSYYPTFHARYLQGMGLGIFAGFGMNIKANQNWSIQLLYSPSFEKINIGPEEARPHLQHTLGLRAFYTL